MTLCNFCNKRESRSNKFDKPYVCKQCSLNPANYAESNEDIIFIDDSYRRTVIKNDTEIDIINTHSDVNVNEQPIDTSNYKDALLANLYTQIEFLKHQICEKDLLIRTLINKDVRKSQTITSSISSDRDSNLNHEKQYDDITDGESSFGGNAENRIKNNTDDDDDDDLFRETYNEYEHRKKQNLDEQLREIRQQKHNQFEALNDEKQDGDDTENNNNPKFATNYHYNERENSNPDEIWPPNTILILGDSMINQMDQVRLCNSTKKSVVVRSFGGAGVSEMYPKLEKLLKKKPSTIILHVGTNDSTTKTPEVILDDLLNLRHYIEAKIPGIKVILSSPIIRVDNAKANATVRRLVEKMKLSHTDCLINVNIGEDCLGVKGLHLNTKRGVGRFANNLITLIRKL